MVKGGDVTDSDCTSRAYPKYQQDADDVTLVSVMNRLPIIKFYTYIAYRYLYSSTCPTTIAFHYRLKDLYCIFPGTGHLIPTLHWSVSTKCEYNLL